MSTASWRLVCRARTSGNIGRMLYIASSIVLAVAVAAAQPVPTKRGPDEAQKRAADSWVKDGIAWTTELTAHGQKLGAMLPPILNGKQNGDAMRAELKRSAAVLDAKLEHFKARPSPAFAEMNAFRTTFLDYLAWENRVYVALMTDLLKIAEDKKLKREQKQEALLQTLRASESEENVWKSKIETAMKDVNGAINRH